MLTCSRIMSTTHPAKIRRRWSANWAMWSYSSCAIKELSTDCTCGQCLVESESRRKFNKLRLDALSIPHYVIKKGRCHGARHGKTEVQKVYQLAWKAWKRCCKRVDSQGEHFTGIHDRFLWDPGYRESQVAIGWSEQKCKEWDELAQEDRTYRLTPEEKKRYQGQWYLTLNEACKNELWNFDLILEPPSRWKIVYTTNQENKLKSLSIQINTDCGIFLQAHRGGTSLNGFGNELIILKKWWDFFLLRLVSFTVGCNRRGV